MASVVFYDPYLKVLGGGEKYLLTMLELAARDPGNEIQLVSATRPDPDRWRRLNVDVPVDRFRWRRGGHLVATLASRDADLLVALTNDCPPLSLARSSAAIVQFPFIDVRAGQGWWPTLRRPDRTFRWHSYGNLVCYSQFVAEAIRERLEEPGPIVINPPVDLAPKGEAEPKETKVIAVGRFFESSDANNKKHDILIEAWRQLCARSEAAGWELHLVGGLGEDRGSHAYLERLRRLADGLDVHFHPNAELDELHDLYARSALFWHAAGYGQRDPERFEHFGITTVEAMAFGCVPVVVGLGGQTEIVRDGVDGRLWHDVPGLVAITAGLMADGAGRSHFATKARDRAEQFGKDHFVESVRTCIFVPAGVTS